MEKINAEITFSSEINLEEDEENYILVFPQEISDLLIDGQKITIEF